MHGMLGVIKAAVSLSSLSFSHAGISQASWRQHPAPQRPSHPRGTPGKPKPAAVCSAQGTTHSPVPCRTVLLPHPCPQVLLMWWPCQWRWPCQRWWPHQVTPGLNQISFLVNLDGLSALETPNLNPPLQIACSLTGAAGTATARGLSLTWR